MPIARRGVALGLFVALGVLALGVACHGVEVSVLSSEKAVDPGRFATHVFSVENDGAATTTYRLQLTAPDGWGLLGVPATLSLAGGAEDTLFVTATVPPGAAAGTYRLTLRVVSQADPSDAAEASAVTTVHPVRAVALQLPEGRSVPPGEPATYPITVVNRGNAQDTFELRAISAHGYPVDVPQTLLSLAAQETASVSVTVDVPGDAGAGRDVLTVSVTSTRHPTISEEETLFTTVLPPQPQAVGGTLLATLPIRLSLSIGQNVFSEARTSDLTASMSGSVFDGTFSTSLSLASLYGPAPLSLDALSISYRRSPTRFAIGDVSRTLTDLLSVSCRGAAVDVDADLYGLDFAGGAVADGLDVGGHLVLGPREARLGLAYFGARGAAVDAQAWTLTASCEPLPGWRLRAEGGLAVQGEKTGRALFLATTIDVPAYYLSARAFRVGTHFPGTLSDQAGVTLSQRFEQEGVSLGATIHRLWNNVDADPHLPRAIDDQLELDLTAAPLLGGPDLLTTVTFDWLRDADRAFGDQVTRVTSIAVQETTGTVPYALTGRVTDRLDRVAGTSERTLSFSQGIGLSTDNVECFLTLTQARTVDRLTGAVQSAGATVSLKIQPRGSPHRATLTFDAAGDDFDLKLSTELYLADALSLTLGGALSWNRIDAMPPDFAWTAGLRWSFDLPIPFLVTKGRLVGRVFIDEDADGRYGPGDRPVDGAILSAGKTQVSTDVSGAFRFPPFAPGDYTLAVAGLPRGAAKPSERAITLRAGQTAYEAVALSPVTVVTGAVFDDENENGTLDAGEGGFGQVTVILANAAGDVARTMTDARGRFTFSGAFRGDYTISLAPSSLPDRFAFTTPQTVAIALPGEQASGIAIGGHIRPKAVVITFQPPTADFSWSPKAPAVGELILFDGSDSFDFDGQIADYAWDLDGDGTTDATGVNAQTTFSTPGPHDVTLSVTDNDGNTDAITHTITVSP